MITSYFVNGFKRQGTSGMMKSLGEGGLPVAYNPKRDAWLTKRWSTNDGYDPNQGGFYELTLPQYLELGFPRRYEGMLFKFLWSETVTLSIVPGDYKGVFMRRPYRETLESCKAMTDFRNPFPSETAFNQRSDDMLGILQMRRDMDVVECDYPALCENPLPFYESLVERGWPIDPMKAAAVIDKQQHRFVATGIS